MAAVLITGANLGLGLEFRANMALTAGESRPELTIRLQPINWRISCGRRRPGAVTTAAIGSVDAVVPCLEQLSRQKYERMKRCECDHPISSLAS
jgi:hypothetical protein